MLPGSRFYPPSYPNVLLPPPPPMTPPGGPRGLRATTLNRNTIRLDWTDNSDNETGFMIDGTGGFFTVRANTSTANAGGLFPETTYCFRVGSYNDYGEAWSNEACATTAPSPAP